MELVFFTVMTVLSAFLTPCAYSLPIQVQPFSIQAGKVEIQVPKLFPALPRKLGLAEKEVAIVGQEGQDSAPDHKQQKENVLDAAGAKSTFVRKEEGDAQKMMHRSRSGTWQEWIEGDDNDNDTSEFFTMDYTGVRRRRPVHNKSLKPKGVNVAAAVTP